MYDRIQILLQSVRGIEKRTRLILAKGKFSWQQRNLSWNFHVGNMDLRRINILGERDCVNSKH